MSLPYTPDLADQEMDPELRRLLQRDLVTLPRWDVLRYFLEGESDSVTLDGLGQALARDSEVLLGTLGELTSLGWLARRVQGGETHYGLTQEVARRALLDRFHTALHERPFRLQAIYHWTREG